jgi:integrase
VTKAKEPGMYADGGGLYLRVAEGGSKQWVFRYAANGRLRDMGIGPEHTLTLAEARQKATEARKLRLEGIDPIDQRRAHRAAQQAAAARAKTFRECAEGFIKDNDKRWGNPKHASQWERSFEQYVYPVIGGLPITTIDTPIVLTVIKPLWKRIPSTAKRILGRIENVLGWATVHHYRAGDNPARWQGHLEHALPAISQVAKIEHHAALPYLEAPAFMAKLREDSSIPARCLELIALTATRSNEGTDALWSEIDFENKLWTIPAARMKAHRDHRVPLSEAAVAVLTAMKEIRCSDYVFPALRGEGKAISAQTIWRLAKTAAGRDITVHGLRSTFRDWAAERTAFPRDVAEMALAHAIPSAVEAAYRRGDLFEKRRKLMEAWAEFCGKL